MFLSYLEFRFPREVLDSPETQTSLELLELSTEDRRLGSARNHSISASVMLKQYPNMRPLFGSSFGQNQPNFSCKRPVAMLLLAFLCVAPSAALEVLDVGAPRTGTQSMHVAMNILGLNTLHSGYSFLKRAPWCEYVFANGSLEDAMATLEGYDAAMDEPFQLVYEEIMRAFPKTKFVLTISDPERWYESYTELIAGMEETENRTHDRYLPSGFRSWLESDVITECTAARYWGCDFGNETGEDTKKQCLEAH